MNSEIKCYFDEEFLKNTNPHKFIILWASKFHRTINKVMRNHLIQSKPKQHKYALFFIQKLIKYFFKHGMYKKDIKFRFLYRGLSSDFVLRKQYHEDAFMSTSYDKAVAKTFAIDDGIVIKFEVDMLPNNVPFVIIDEHVADYLLESEFLFLPGTINIIKDNMATYNPNHNLIKYYQNLTIGGGNLDQHNEPCFKIPELELSNKYIVWYRALQNRPVEILKLLKIPSKYKDIISFFQTVVNKFDTRYEIFTDFIPEYQDLAKKENKTTRECKLVMSYTVHTAIYDADKRKVDTICYGCLDELYEELYDVSRKEEIMNKITEYANVFAH
jgi:hypothetical protein